MTLALPSGPIQEEIITLSSSQVEELGRYHLEKVDNLTAKWDSYRNQELPNEKRDELLANSYTEVKALVSFTIDGGFARDFLYINNELHNICVSIRNALGDLTVMNIQWAEATTLLLEQRWISFANFVILHEKDMKVLAQHCVIVMESLYGLVEKVISMVTDVIKDLFKKLIKKIRKYALPAAFIAIGSTAGVISIVAQMTNTLSFNLAMSVGIGVGIVATLSFQKGWAMVQKEGEKEVKEEVEVTRIGLRRFRDSIQKLLREIEDRKSYEDDRGGIWKPYRDCERRIIPLKNKIENCINYI